MNTPLMTALIIVGIVAFFIVLIWSMKRHRDPTLRVECDDSIEDLMPSLAGLSLNGAVGGNSVEIFENGAFFDALIEDIDGASKSVHFESFLWKEGELGQRLAAAFVRRARGRARARPPRCARGSKKRRAGRERHIGRGGS